MSSPNTNEPAVWVEGVPFERLEGEADDSERFRRAVAYAQGIGVKFVDTGPGIFSPGISLHAGAADNVTIRGCTFKD